MKKTRPLFQLGALVLALAFSINLHAGAGGRGGGGGDDGGISFARIMMDPDGAVRSDGGQLCEELWDYWDHRDTEPNGCDAGITADVSSGGRLHFGTINLQGTDPRESTLRWLVLDFTNPDPDYPESDPNPDIDLLYEGGVTDPPYDPNSGIDNVKTFVVLNNMFKSGATQDSLSITIRDCEDANDCSAVPTGYTLQWVEDVNILDTADPDVRILTTDGTSHQAVLLYDDPNTKSKKAVQIGRYIMPIHWAMKLVPSP